MDNPGLSLFQGGASINVNDDAQIFEEEEELEDLRRRNEQLEQEFETAFDDLSDDDEHSTVDSSVHYAQHVSHDNLPIFNGHTNFNQAPSYGFNETHANELQCMDNSDAQHVNNNPDNQQYFENNTHQMQHPENERVDIIGQGDECYMKARYGSLEQLQVLYDVRVREVERLTAQLGETQHHNEQTIIELRKQLGMAQAEKERAIISRQQTQELLVQSKSEVGNLLNQIDSLKANVHSLEERNNIMTNELQIAKSSLTDTHNRLQMMEKGFGNNERQVEHMLKTSQERFAEETKSMEARILHLKNKVESYEIDMKHLESRCKELQREKESIMIEKAESINQLAQKLEDSQRQCQLMIGSQVSVAEYKKLNSQLMLLESQNETLKKQLKEVTTHLESATMESGFESLGETDSIRGLRLGGSTSTPMTDHESMLRNELRRCMMGQKLKRDEIKRLEDIIKSKEYEIQMLQDTEASVKLQVDHYKSEFEKISEKLAETENNLKLVELQNRNDITNILSQDKQLLQQKHDEEILENKKLRKTITELENKITNLIREVHNKSQNDKTKLLQSEIDKLSFQLKDAQNEVDRMKNLYVEICTSKEQLIRQLDEIKNSDVEIELNAEKEKVFLLQNKLEAAENKGHDLITQLEKQKMENEILSKSINDKIQNARSEAISNYCMSQKQTLCTEHLIKIAKIESECSHLTEKCTKLSKDIEFYQTKLEVSNKEMAELQSTLALKAQRDSLIENLKAKAEQFEEFMSNESKKNSNTNYSSASPRPITSEKATATSPIAITDPVKEQILQKNHEEALLQCENKVREDMAILFANEIKNLDIKYKSEKSIAENQYAENLSSLQKQLNIKQREIDVLKRAILLERAHMKELKDQKENIDNDKCNETENSLKICQNQLKECQQKVYSLTVELAECSKQASNDRDKMAAIMQQWAAEVRALREKHEEKEKSLTLLQEKYQIAKKTAKNYKNYAADKEKHLTNEYERIKAGYQEALEKIQKKMENVISEKEKMVNERVMQIEAKYEDKIKTLKK